MTDHFFERCVDGPLDDFVRRANDQAWADLLTATQSLTVPAPPANPVVDALNAAYAADPDAVHALMCNRVPCNNDLADHPTVVVDKSTLTGGWTVGAIGLINGVLGALGLPLVAIQFTEGIGPDGRHQLLGFQAYTPPARLLDDTPGVETKESDSSVHP